MGWSHKCALPLFVTMALLTAVEPPAPVGAVAGEARTMGGMKVCWCPPGKFTMGSPKNELHHRSDETQVEVVLTRGFWAGTYEVTQGQWKQLIGAFPQAQPAGEGNDFPVVWVNYAEAEAFCAKLTEIARAEGTWPAGWVFRLPTEAQWEYACRAGTSTATAFGDTLDTKQANIIADGDENKPIPKHAVSVGRYPANTWGLHDMHGNAFEWCRDWYHARLPGGNDPELTVKGEPNRDGTFSRVRRGGAWNDTLWACRSAFRLRYEPERRSDHIGFRVVAVAP